MCFEVTGGVSGGLLRKTSFSKTNCIVISAQLKRWKRRHATAQQRWRSQGALDLPEWFILSALFFTRQIFD
jgi:hypothetical protein